MKKVYIVLITIIIIFTSIAIIIQSKFDNTYQNLKLVEYKDGDILKKNTNVIVSGKINFTHSDIYDNEYKIKFPFPFIKRINNVSDSYGWKDSQPVYYMRKGNINGLHFSQEAIKDMCNEIVKHNANYKIEDKSIEPYFYSDSDYPYFTKTNEEGLWRIRYYTKELQKDTMYTYIGRWNGESLEPIKELKSNLFEGVLSSKELDNQNNSKKYLLFSTFLGLGIVLTIVLVILILINRKYIKK